MSLASQLINSGDFIFYEPKLLQIFDDHVEFLRNHPQTVKHLPDPNITNLYNRDALGLFGAYGVMPQYRIIVMKVNRIQSTTDDISQLKEIFIPNYGVITKIINSYNSVYGVS